ncbi:MAG: type II secretion system protein GspL, partial [Burkholderiales bacterium]|nr:type II secretion system protein GspL [Burkholderiales bacterium]
LPALLAGATAAVAVIGLNLHWAQLARERTELRQAMEAGFRQAFPKAQVVVDPLLQMRRQTAELRLRAGQDGPEDFLPLLLRFTRPRWGRLAPRIFCRCCCVSPGCWARAPRMRWRRSTIATGD